MGEQAEPVAQKAARGKSSKAAKTPPATKKTAIKGKGKNLKSEGESAIYLFFQLSWPLRFCPRVSVVKKEADLNRFVRPSIELSFSFV